MRLKKWGQVVIGVLGFVTICLANEAPVVDVQQDVAATQTDAATSGNWQPVSGAQSANNNTWQPVTTSPPAQKNSPSEQQPVMQAGNGALDQRVNRLEQQMANYTQMNLPQQVSDLQQKVSQLQGQLEVAKRDLKMLSSQQELYYQDLEQQVAQLKTPLGAASDKSNVAANKLSTSLTQKQPQATQTAVLDQRNSASQNNNHQASLSDANTYNNAFRLLSNKHFTQAKTAFHYYLKQYPDGHFAMNTHFWLGEIALMHEQYDPALKQFQTVVDQYPASNKVSDAKLKIAMIHAATGKISEAQTEFSHIRTSYPGTTAAQLANIRLQQLAAATNVSVQ